MCKACDLVKGFLIVQGYNACHTLDRRQHVFPEEGKADFPFLKRTDDKLFCSKCRSLFSIERGGRLDIIQHTQMKKHKLAAEEVDRSLQSCMKNCKQQTQPNIW